MPIPIIIDSALDWINKVPELLLPLDESSEILNNEEFINYVAIKLTTYFKENENQFAAKICQILEEGTDSGKLVLLRILFNSTSIWNDLVQVNNLQPLLTELALTPDKIFTQTAVLLSQKLVEFASSISTTPSPTIASVLSAKTAPISEEPVKAALEEQEEKYEEITSQDVGSRVEELADKDRDESRLRKAKRFSAPSPKKERAAIPPPSPGSIPSPAPARSPPTNDVDEKAKKLAPTKPLEALDDFLEEPSPDADEFEEVSITDEVTSGAIPHEIDDIKEAAAPKKIFTHIHYFNRMNTRNTYPFKVSLSTIAKRVRTRRMHILTGERETETQEEFELDQATRQIMVELLISGCLVQPTFQYVDPENLPTELTYYVTPLVEAGFSSTRLEGELILKSDLGLLLQRIPLQDVYVVSNRISKIAAVIGAIGGGTLPALDFLFGVSLQEALTGQLAYTAPEIAESIDIRSVITVSQIAIFFLFIGFGLLWWWRKGRSRKASQERLPVNLPS